MEKKGSKASAKKLDRKSSSSSLQKGKGKAQTQAQNENEKSNENQVKSKPTRTRTNSTSSTKSTQQEHSSKRPSKRKNSTSSNGPESSLKPSVPENDLDVLNDLELEQDDDIVFDDDDENASESSEAESFPELVDDDDSEEDDDDESFDDDDDEEAEDNEDEDEALLKELEEEEELERQLAQEEDSDSGSEVGEGPEAVDRLIKRYTVKPDEAAQLDFNARDYDDDSRVLGYDTRDYKDKANTVVSNVTGQPKFVWEEIEPGYDSDDDPEHPNRVGNVPAHFYDDMPHIGYDIDGKRVMRPARKDELDKFLSGLEDDAWQSVEDKNLQQSVKLTDQELDLVRRLTEGTNPDGDYDPYTPQIEVFTRRDQEMKTPLNQRPEPKSRFLPSSWEHKKVMKIVKAIREGRIVPNKPKDERSRYYALWTNDDAPRPDHPMNMPAPKLKLPTHAESYNPPEEYLFTEQERKEWEEADPADRKIDFIPQKYDSLRKVPGYKDFVQQRFNRLLDLYLAPRMRRRRPKLDINEPEDLLPKLPDPRELRPFPTYCAVTYPHPDKVRVRCTSIDPSGQWLLTGADDGHVRLWELITGFCLSSWNLGNRNDKSSPIYNVAWCPNSERPLFVASVKNGLTVVSPTRILKESLQNEIKSFISSPQESTIPSAAQTKWHRAQSVRDEELGILIDLDVPGTPKQITWHRRGDYFATVASDVSGASSVLIHQLSKHHTQAPFKRNKGAVQCVSFHPTKPHFFVATQRYVRVYDLQDQSMIKTLNPGSKWISSIDVHSSGDHVVIGGYDKKVTWHDMDLSEAPYKTLKYHQRAVRCVSYHTRRPLFLTTSDDGTIQLFHSTVYNDLVTNPLIVPLKVLRGHEINDGLGVLDAVWHPKEPWLVSVGADGTGRLWCN